MTKEAKVYLQDATEAMNLLGTEDAHLKMLEKHLGTRLVVRGEEMTITGSVDEVDKTEAVVKELLDMVRQGHLLTPAGVAYVISQVEEGHGQGMADALAKVIATTHRGRPIKAKTLGQAKYLEALENHSIVFGIGPAGTGKTYLAVVMAVLALRAKEINRIVLTRPAVEAGEKLGFLPGDLQEKVDPYLRPLYDALYDLLGPETTQRYVEKGTIEIAPLAYMRGRTLDDSFMILDEAQNTTPEQMKMFLTRLGYGSHAVVTGDVTQVDLPRGHYSGLKEVQNILKGLPDISFHYFTAADVVRNPLVQKIIQAYEKAEETSEPGQ
ncbi:phosphate starvation-inducible protein PhoH [Desulfitobacterium sp. LBE]|uniref:PhoH-like protein n=5 Tax=root TaxID=1 RepID=Q24SU2_DESHY|nr:MULTISPECIES: PhoH family protein [Desulfitobacterium]ACL22285.1 PhoH family protein [Desulfitobacterium hafniense DCB-2]EHL04472.1 PhoH family protein [Desulfitobacterium hafniense DP7]KTE92107.1 phosphate starvation-inducible protein PhoH [Desulfitobacterium hafniense]MEA5021389.1 PhoH family protein [Desulfitobacterium hafniense]TWH59940.1 phosphate starvation-inducible protein PhoH [Desulfitobacterium sp. LBE]